jgi:type II secretory pathway predicted ATPase ExeA
MHDTLTRHFTLTDMPFRRDLEPAALHRYNDHQQACARITWTIADKALGVLTGEVCVGKTVAVRSAIVETSVIAGQFGRSPRWGRWIKNAGLEGDIG